MAMSENDKIKKYGPVVCHVKSRESGDEYQIRLKDGVHHCNCRGFIFSKEVPKSCKHIKAFLEQNGTRQKAAELTEVQITERCLRTAGMYDTLKENCKDAFGFQHQLSRLAQALTPYFGGSGPVESAASDDIRVIFFD